MINIVALFLFASLFVGNVAFAQNKVGNTSNTGNKANSGDSSNPETVTEADIALYQNQALIKNPFGNFFEYQVKGMCVWMYVTPYGVQFEETLYVSHFLPDLLVSVFKHHDSNPVVSISNSIDKGLQAAGEATFTATMGMSSGDGNSGEKATTDSARFYEVGVYGNPMISEFSTGFQTHETVATPYMIYYSSLTDKIMWHNPEVEILLHPSSLIPLLNNEGSMIAPWGQLYPRYGSVTQFSQYKAAAMIALRATHIATSTGQPHIYMPIDTGATACGQGCRVYESDINSPDKVRFQRIFPDPEIDFEDFGYNDLFDATLDAYGAKWTQQGDDNYVWLMWRKYEGCIQGKGSLVAVMAG